APGGALSNHYEACRSFLLFLNEETGGDFAALSDEARDELLTRLEADPETGRPFRRIVEWITEGFYASPAGWDLVGFCPVGREAR
ncbi:MAG: gluconate 2-dehydrogenase subunit 3 family protein, partial [Fibrella sp.]|nr:gluconate 2-dehydrogenase subunit 3 family protein [Armatimonadota bacterium]